MTRVNMKKLCYMSQCWEVDADIAVQRSHPFMSSASQCRRNIVRNTNVYEIVHHSLSVFLFPSVAHRTTAGRDAGRDSRSVVHLRPSGSGHFRKTGMSWRTMTVRRLEHVGNQDAIRRHLRCGTVWEGFELPVVAS